MVKFFLLPALLFIFIVLSSLAMATDTVINQIWLEPYLLADAKGVISSFDNPALDSYTLSDFQGTVDVEQYLKFEETGTNPFKSTGKIVFDLIFSIMPIRLSYDKSRFLRFNYGTPIFEFETNFVNGFESKINSSNSLANLQKKELVILGKKFKVINSELIGNSLTLNMVNPKYSISANDGSSRTITLPSGNHDIQIIYIDLLTRTVDIRVDRIAYNDLKIGQCSNALPEGIFVQEIIPGTLNSVVLGIDGCLKFFDNDVTDNLFRTGVELNGRLINDGRVLISGNYLPSGNFELQKIEYRLNARGSLTQDLNVPSDGFYGIDYKNELVRDYVFDKNGFLHNNWDIIYNYYFTESGNTYSLTKEPYGYVGPTPYLYFINSVKTYKLDFSNSGGVNLLLPIVDHSGSDFTLGSDLGETYFVEPSNFCDFANSPLNIGDFFIITIPLVLGITDNTFGFLYEDADVSSQELVVRNMIPLYFPQSRYSFTVSPLCGPGTIIAHGLIAQTYDFWIDLNPASTTYKNMIVDYNADGVIDGKDVYVYAGFESMHITTGGRHYFDLNLANNGLLQQEPYVTSSYDMGFTTPLPSFDYSSSGADEKIQILVSMLPDDVNVEVTSGVNFIPDPSDPLKKYGLTQYGISIIQEPACPFGRRSCNGNKIVFKAPRNQEKSTVTITFIPELSKCNDGIDNDFDGFIDASDRGCAISGGTTEIGGRFCGDVTNDGIIDMTDALYVAKSSVGSLYLSGTDFACGDVDSSGVLNLADVFLILRHSAGYPVSFFCTGCV